MKKITLTQTQNAYPAQGVLNARDENGVISPRGWSEWYEAAATDADGNVYTVCWEVLDGYTDGDDESFACNWDKPVMVLDENNQNILSNIAF